jgi:hypothetical protein
VNQTFLGFEKKKKSSAIKDAWQRKTEMILFHDLKFRELSCLLRPIVVCFFLQVSCSIAFVCKQ